MSLMTKLVSAIMGLPPVIASKLEHQIDLKIPMADGVVLLANRVAPLGGEFQPFRDEREDGLATLDWISRQPWFSGSVGMYGLPAVQALLIM